MLAPEYGGDGGKKVGICAEKKGPVAFFPSHWAPNDLLIYTGKAFPAAYRGGAFVAFHGSWNRAPAPQGGYDVVFQPLSNGKAAGNFIVFADGFAGAVREPGRAAFRPTGLAYRSGRRALYWVGVRWRRRSTKRQRCRASITLARADYGTVERRRHHSSPKE